MTTGNATGNVRRVCTLSNHVVTVPDAVAERRDWFSSGPLSRLGPLHGWGASSPSLPGEAPQSRLFCPLTSLGLLVVEARRAVPAYSTGPRVPAPYSQAQFWTSRARDVIHPCFRGPFFVSYQRQTLGCRTRQPSVLGSLRRSFGSLHSGGTHSSPHHDNVGSGSLRRLVRLKELPNKVDGHLHPQHPPRCPSHLRSSLPPRGPWLLLDLHSPLHGALVSNPCVTTTAPVEACCLVRNRPSLLAGVGPVHLTRFLRCRPTSTAPQ